jgi:hypothetical protein
LSDAGFCVWLAGAPVKVVAAIARSVATDLAHARRVEELGPGPEWLAGAPPARRWKTRAHLARTLAAHGVIVVLATEVADEPWRSEVRGVVPAVIEVVVGEEAPGDWGPDLVVPGDGSRAGESARVVLRHLAAAGWTEPLEDYTDDDEAAVSGRLQNFGYL